MSGSSEGPFEESAIDAAEFRQVLGHFPTGVVIVTGFDVHPMGLAIGSFTSVSLEPPMVGFFPARTSSTWPRIEQTGVFAVNMLGEEHEEVSRVFAGKEREKFEGIGWKPGMTGSPVLEDAVAYVECSVESVTPAGDHWFVLGRVLDLALNRAAPPLVFYRGGYGRLSP